MKKEHLKYLACPCCKGDLCIIDVQKQSDVSVETGVLGCLKCDAKYDIIRHIPRFVPLEKYAIGFGLEWTIHSRTQYDSYTGSNVSEKRFFEETRWHRRLQGEIILEVGSGSGRFTEQAASTGAMVISLDYSYAVDANYASNGTKNNVLIVQADVYRMPFREGLFDKIFCIGVLQYTPDPAAAFAVLPRYLKSGGSLVVDIYRKIPWVKRLLLTKYWVRPITKRMQPLKLYSWCKRYVEFMWPISRVIAKSPFLGKRINWMLLVADYRGMFSLSEEMLKEWAVLDTFNMLNPAYEYPQFIETVERWFKTVGLRDVEVHIGYNGIEGRGIKP